MKIFKNPKAGIDMFKTANTGDIFSYIGIASSLIGGIAIILMHLRL